MNLDAFVEKFNGYTEPYFFYDGSVELRYDPKEHLYFLIEGGQFVAQDGVTSVCHIIDKSEALIPWGCKMMGQKLLATVPVATLPTGERLIPQQSYEDFERLVIASKNAHKEKLEEAASVGNAAHAWIEEYIKAVLANDDARRLEVLAKFPEDERSRNCCTAALQWMVKHNVRWIRTECKIYSRLYRFAGTMDGLAMADSCDDITCCKEHFTDRISVIDWKSSNYLYTEYALQTAAYWQAYAEEHGTAIQDRWIIRLGKTDGEFEPWHLPGREDFEADFSAFFFCLILTRTMKLLKQRTKERADAVKAERKAQDKAAREAALLIKCRYADKYKGKRYPNCNKGNPCQACLAKYAEVQATKAQDVNATAKSHAASRNFRRV